MNFIRKKISLIGLFMATIMLLISTPYEPIFAAMISSEDTFYQIKAQDARDHLKTLISRNDVTKLLIAQGIDPDEAIARIESLSDPEVKAIADRIEQLPAGGNAVGAIIGAALIVFLVLLITDILGYTDVFPFVKSKK
jgi:hypothetical protein